MCIIALKKSGVPLPTEVEFRNCFRSNPDGAGLALVRGGVVMIRKGFMTVEAFLAAVTELDIQLDEVAAFHFRITTSGGTKPENCHPFPASSNELDLKNLSIDTDFAVIHNGIFGAGTKDLSDTMLFVRDVVSDPFVRVAAKAGHRTCFDYLGKNTGTCRMVYLFDTGAVEISGSWVDGENGLIFSNDRFKTPTYYPAAGYTRGYAYRSTMGEWIGQHKDKDGRIIPAHYEYKDDGPSVYVPWSFTPVSGTFVKDSFSDPLTLSAAEEARIALAIEKASRGVYTSDILGIEVPNDWVNRITGTITIPTHVGRDGIKKASLTLSYATSIHKFKTDVEDAMAEAAKMVAAEAEAKAKAEADAAAKAVASAASKQPAEDTGPKYPGDDEKYDGLDRLLAADEGVCHCPICGQSGFIEELRFDMYFCSDCSAVIPLTHLVLTVDEYINLFGRMPPLIDEDFDTEVEDGDNPFTPDDIAD